MKKRFYRLIALAFTHAIFLNLFPLKVVWAQSNIVPDDTLGTNQSGVVPLDTAGFPIDIIGGGLTNGNNLFHSFLEFNVGEGRGVYFRNGNSNITNILSRVTGNNRSEILGTLGIFNAPGINASPDLLFLNPNGILFGPQATLDLPAAFVATTANTIRLGEEGGFSADQPETDQLLDIDPSALVFSEGSSIGSIRNQAINGLPAAGFFQNAGSFSIPSVTTPNGTVGFRPQGLQVPDGEKLALVGGDVMLDGGVLTAVGGTIDIGSVSGAGIVGIDLGSTGFISDYADVNQFGDISLSSALVNASGLQGGRIQIQSARLFTDEENTFSGISADTQGALGGQEIFVRASEEIFLDNAAISTFVQPGAIGGGNIRLESPRIFISGGNSSVLARNTGTGRAGDIDIKTDYLTLREGAGILSSTLGSGDAGNLTIRATEQVEAQGAGTFMGEEIPGGIQSDIRGTGKGGTVGITTRRLVLSEGAIVSTRTDDGSGGSVIINATESIDLLPGGAISTQTFGLGDAGNIQIRTDRIATETGSEVTASAEFRSGGDAGDIEIIAEESVIANGGGYINAVIGADSNGGTLTIRTPYLSLRNGGTVSSQVITIDGRAGNINIVADTIEVLGATEDAFLASQISASSARQGEQSSEQPLGSVDIQTRRLVVENGGQVSVDSIGEGAAGSLNIQASESIEVTHASSPSTNELTQEPLLSRISATSSGDSGGDITLSTPTLIVSGPSEVTVSSRNSGNAGDINISGETIALDNAGSINAISPSGEGGNVTLRLGRLLTLRRGASLSTSAGTAGESGNGGNIELLVPFIVAIPEENSDVSANAFSGDGGRVDIQSTGLFGIASRPRPTVLSDITASSEVGTTGIVDINASDTEFIEDNLTDLADDLVSSEALVANSCIARNSGQSGTFTVASSDDLPEQPATNQTPYSIGNIQAISPGNISEALWHPGEVVVEPQDIYQLSDGRFVMSRECR